MTLCAHGRFGGGFGWIAHPDEFQQRSSAAWAEGGRVWLIDPVRPRGADGEALEGEFESLGTVAAIVLTLGRHERDAPWYAARFGVPIYASRHLIDLPAHGAAAQRIVGEVPDSPLEVIDYQGNGVMRFWRESGVWWPEQHSLAVGDLLGTAAYYLLHGERLAMHMIGRLAPPPNLLSVSPQRLFCGHGMSLDDEVPSAMEQAVRSARRRLPASWWHVLRSGVRWYREQR